MSIGATEGRSGPCHLAGALWRAHAPIGAGKTCHPQTEGVRSHPYMGAEGHRVSRAEFEENLASKMADPRFTADVGLLLAPGVDWSPQNAAALIQQELVARLPGEGWRGEGGSLG